MRATAFLLGASVAGGLALAGCSSSPTTAGSSAIISSSAVASTALLASGAAPGASSATAPPGTSPTPTGLDAQALLARARTAATTASSLRVAGTMMDGGQKITIDLQYKGDAGGTGRITVPEGPMDVIRIGSTLYIRASAQTWTALAKDSKVGAALGGKWVKGSTKTKDFAEMASLTTLSEMPKTMLAPGGTLTVVPGRSAGSVPAIGLQDVDGSVLLVAAADPGYPLALVAAGAGGRLDFTDYGKPVQLTAPPAAQVISLPGS